MFSLPIPFLLCPGDGSIYEILRDNQLTNQPFRGFNLNNSKFYSFPDFWDNSFNFYIVLPGIETVKCVCVCVCVCVRACVRARACASYSVIVFDRAINGHDRYMDDLRFYVLFHLVQSYQDKEGIVQWKPSR